MISENSYATFAFLKINAKTNTKEDRKKFLGVFVYIICSIPNYYYYYYYYYYCYYYYYHFYYVQRNWLLFIIILLFMLTKGTLDKVGGTSPYCKGERKAGY